MDLLLMRALLYIAKYCVQCGDCKKCLIRAFCGKQPLEWYSRDHRPQPWGGQTFTN